MCGIDWMVWLVVVGVFWCGVGLSGCVKLSGGFGLLWLVCYGVGWFLVGVWN